MPQKSFVVFIASWLVVRLRLGLLSTRLTLQRFFNQPPVILVTRRARPFPEGRWVMAGEQLHFLSISRPPETIEVRSLPKPGHN